jgi:hypothetical protein
MGGLKRSAGVPSLTLAASKMPSGVRPTTRSARRDGESRARRRPCARDAIPLARRGANGRRAAGAAPAASVPSIARLRGRIAARRPVGAGLRGEPNTRVAVAHGSSAVRVPERQLRRRARQRQEAVDVARRRDDGQRCLRRFEPAGVVDEQPDRVGAHQVTGRGQSARSALPSDAGDRVPSAEPGRASNLSMGLLGRFRI